MATNTDLPNGFNPHGAILGQQRYQKDSGESTPVFAGDLMEAVTDGYVNVAATGKTELVGSAAHFLTGSATGTVMIYDDPDQKFAAQDDGSGTPSMALLGLNADHNDTVGSLTDKISDHEIALSTGTTATAGVRLLDFVVKEGNVIADHAEWVVRINEHTYGNTTGI